MTKSDESIGTTTNDGNENSQQCESIDLSVLRNIVTQLKEMYIAFLNQIKLIQKDLIRKSKYDELESKVSKPYFIYTYHYIMQLDGSIQLVFLPRRNNSGRSKNRNRIRLTLVNIEQFKLFLSTDKQFSS